MKIALFGGSFDPFHSDHLNMIKLVKKKLSVNEVWIIPTNKNPFKKRKLTSIKHRLKMIRLSVKNLRYVKISRIELTNNKPSVTYDTINKLKKKYPNYKFYFMIGSDQLSDLDNWNNIEKLIKIQTFVIYERNTKIDSSILKKYNAIKINFKKNFYLSSTLIRNGKKLEKQIPGVNDYINNNLLYLNERVKKQMDNKRFKHCLNTGIMSKKLAKIYNLDVNKALIAGTFHDITKRWSKKKHRIYLRKYYPEFLKYEPYKVWHAYTGYLYLKYKLLFKDKEILNAIKWHTVGHPNMTKLEMIIFVADKISIERSYYNINKYRELAFNNLQEAFKLILIDQYNLAIKKYGIKNLGKNIINTYEWINNSR